MLLGLLFITNLIIGHCTTEMNHNTTSGMPILKVEKDISLISFKRDFFFKGTGEGPRATPCAFWNEFIPMLRKENRTGI